MNRQGRSGRTARPDAYDRCPRCGGWKRRKSGACGGCHVARVNSGSFRRGPRPELRKKLGSERVDRRSGEVLVKVSGRNPWLPGTGSGLWAPRRRVRWEEKHGKVPPGLIVRRLTDDPRDDDPEHMVLISKAVNVALNQGRWTQPARPWDSLPRNLPLRRLAVLAAIAYTLAAEMTGRLPKAERLTLRRRRDRRKAGAN